MIWHDFMTTAKGDNCDDFPPPTEPAEFSPYFGKYASTGSAGTGTYYDSTATPDDSAPTTDEEYDPRFYEEAPLDAPETPPADEVAPEPGNGNGNGNGNANGQQGGVGPG
jgi:hypothetical protein